MTRTRRPDRGEPSRVPRLFAILSPGSERNLLDTLRTEKAGGVLLLLGAVAALAWANSPWSESYASVRGTVVGPHALHLDLTLEQWATDGLLTIFFFVVGLELKREMVAGDLRRPATAAVPIVAAIGGMAVPALIYVGVNAASSTGDLAGWAVPTATDIAFAVSVLAVVGRNLPNTLRAFLLTLAVVDDLLAIIVIAVFYGQEMQPVWLLVSLGAAAVFAVLLRRGLVWWPVLLLLGVVAWATMHASGVHATIAGVVLGFCVPALPRAGLGEQESLAERFEHRWRPVSAGVAVPLFALVAAGVTLEPSALGEAVRDPVAQGVALGLVLGKPIGIVGATWLAARIGRTDLAPGIRWPDVAGVGLVGGIGFTVSLLIGALAFGEGSDRDDHVKAAILVASLTAAALGAGVLAVRDRYHKGLVAPLPER